MALDDLIEEKAWTVLAMASATLAGMAVRNLLKTGWQRIRDDDPPANPAEPSVDWWDGLTWTIATGVAVGVARLLARRGAAEGWRRVRGEYPAGLE